MIDGWHHNFFYSWRVYQLYSRKPRAQRICADVFVLINSGLMPPLANSNEKQPLFRGWLT